MSTWHIDGAHSEIGFKVKHLMVSNVKGFFEKFSGTLTTDDDDLTNAKVSFETDVASISTRNEARDKHLKSGDFFDADKFPKITFTSTSFTKKPDDNFTVVGDLTMRGVTKSIELNVLKNGIAKGMDGKRVMSFDVEGMINRMDFGVSWNSVIEAGGVAVSPEVWLIMGVELIEE